MTYVFGILGIVASYFLIYYRERVGDMLGEPDWAAKVGGIYNVVILLAIFIFFWSLAAMTGTLGTLFSPLLWILPIQPHTPPPSI